MAVINGNAVVNLAGVDHDYVSTGGFDLSNSTPGALCPAIDQAYTELIVGVPGKVMIGSDTHELYAPKRRSELRHLMDSFDHFASHVSFTRDWMGPSSQRPALGEYSGVATESAAGSQHVCGESS